MGPLHLCATRVGEWLGTRWVLSRQLRGSVQEKHDVAYFALMRARLRSWKSV